ncbi:ficolin-2-like [Ostrea edulis]|uniref:ficolin-2-like n=1 Tax=Ostrea edulis TaxID=37623 RepID=UPI0020961AB7|nr:ficolin-2-like [Ostrea edulis]
MGFDFILTMCTKWTLCIVSVWISLLHTMHGQLLYNENSNSQHITQNIERRVMLKLDGIMKEKINEMDKIQKENMKQSFRAELDQLKSMMENMMTNMTESYKNLRNICNCTYKAVEYDKTGIDCADILKKFPETRNKNGVYNITGPQKDKKSVFCDMTTDKGGWTVIQQRINGATEFYRNWSEYKKGFGSPIEDHWLGLELMHTLTTKKTYELRVDVQRFNGDQAYATYSTFSVASEVTKYRLNVSGYTGTAGDSMTYSDGMKFSTKDQDNDDDSGQCATYWKSAWWFKSCFYTNPNGQYTDSEKRDWKYVVWYHWKKENFSLKSIKMMIRPKN